MTDAGFHLAFAIRVPHSAWKRSDAVVAQHIVVQRIERGIVNVGREHALTEIIEDHHVSGSAQPAERLLMQLSPDARAGAEDQNANGLTAVSERQDEQSRPPVPAGFRIAHHRTGAVIDLGFFPSGGFNDHACFRRRRSAQLPHKALHARVFFTEAVAIHQVLPNGHGVPALRQLGFDELTIWFARARRRSDFRF